MAYRIPETLKDEYDEHFYRVFCRLNELMLENSNQPEGNLFYLNYRRLPNFDDIANNVVLPLLADKRFNYAMAVRGKKMMLEVGFNAGHSALIALESNPDLHYVGIDIGRHAYTKPCAKVLKKIYGDRFDIILGPSEVQLPLFITTERASQVDLFHCDGGHAAETAMADLTNFLKMPLAAGVVRHLLLDDTGLPHIREVVQRLINTAPLITESYLGQWKGARNACFRVLPI